MSDVFDDREIVDRVISVPDTLQSAVEPRPVRFAVLAALLSAGCASQAVQRDIRATEPTQTTAVPPQWPVAESKVPIGSMVITRPEPKNEPWPDVPSICVFTGVVLMHDQFSDPSKILLENKCLQERGEDSNIYEGRHKWVESDSQGHYEIPFFNAHLETKPGCFMWQKKGSCLTFVTDQQGNPIREELKPGNKPGTFTFYAPLEAYGIQPW
ncbi:MAG: hypothetical protein V1880_01620 [Patescibacteria group bacterium]